MTEGIAAIVERYEPVSLGRIEPLDLAFDGCLRKWTARTAAFEVCHEFVCAMPARTDLKSARRKPPASIPHVAISCAKAGQMRNRGRGRPGDSAVRAHRAISGRKVGFSAHWHVAAQVPGAPHLLEEIQQYRVHALGFVVLDPVGRVVEHGEARVRTERLARFGK